MIELKKKSLFFCLALERPIITIKSLKLQFKYNKMKSLSGMRAEKLNFLRFYKRIAMQALGLLTALRYSTLHIL